jgi:hypothetical protein
MLGKVQLLLLLCQEAVREEQRGTVPKPAAVAVLGLGVLGFAASRRKSAKGKKA